MPFSLGAESSNDFKKFFLSVSSVLNVFKKPDGFLFLRYQEFRFSEVKSKWASF